MDNIKMSFRAAMKAMSQGFKVRRVGWYDENLTIEFHARPYVTIDTRPRSRVPWIASQADMSAEDWVVYPNAGDKDIWVKTEDWEEIK